VHVDLRKFVSRALKDDPVEVGTVGSTSANADVISISIFIREARSDYTSMGKKEKVTSLEIHSILVRTLNGLV